MSDWRPVHGYENVYEINREGAVRSRDRYCNHVGGQALKKGRVLKHRLARNGQTYVILTLNGQFHRARVNDLLDKTFERPKRPIPSDAERARSEFSYDPEEGVLRWAKNSHNVTDGSPAGTRDRFGYIAVRWLRRQVRAHRIIWLFVHGDWPSGEIDHANGKTDDNRLVNLRLASKSQNMMNTRIRKDNKSGYRGVCWDRQASKWRATITANRKTKTIGVFKNKEDAIAAYEAAAVALHGEFMNTQRR